MTDVGRDEGTKMKSLAEAIHALCWPNSLSFPDGEEGRSRAPEMIRSAIVHSSPTPSSLLPCRTLLPNVCAYIKNGVTLSIPIPVPIPEPIPMPKSFMSGEEYANEHRNDSMLSINCFLLAMIPPSIRPAGGCTRWIKCAFPGRKVGEGGDVLLIFIEPSP